MAALFQDVFFSFFDFVKYNIICQLSSLINILKYGGLTHFEFEI